MQPSPAPKEAGHRAPRERAGKEALGAGSPQKRAKGAPARERPKPGWALTEEVLAAMHPAQCRRHLLFGDLLEDVGAAPSILPRESAELGYRMPDPRGWKQSLEPPAARQDRLLGVLKAAEARGRLRALRLRYTRMRVSPGCRRLGVGGGARSKSAGETCGRKGMGTGWGLDGRGRGRWGWVLCAARQTSSRLRKTSTPHAGDPQAEEISLLIQQQKSARAAIRLELFLPPQLKPTRIPDPLDRQEVPASPGRGRKGGPARLPAHLAPAPLLCSGGAWRPSWRRKSLAAISTVTATACCATLPHKVLTLQAPVGLYAQVLGPSGGKGG